VDRAQRTGLATPEDRRRRRTQEAEGPEPLHMSTLLSTCAMPGRRAARALEIMIGESGAVGGGRRGERTLHPAMII